MKKILLFLLILLHYNNSEAQTSKYIPFPSSNAVWNVHKEFPHGRGCQSYSYTFSGDSIINNLTYHKIWKQGINFYQCSSKITGSFDVYAGAIREVLLEKRIYFLPPKEVKDTLLYDFNLKVGDTVKTYISDWGKLYVNLIDSVLLGTQYRKRWIIKEDGGIGSEIIEGMGNTHGLLEPLPIFELNWRLECFSHNNQTLYPTYNSTSGCDLISSVKENKYLIAINIFPNPTTNRFQVKAENFKIYAIDVTNILGKTIYSTRLNNETTEIDISNQPAGVYFVRVQNNKEGIVATKKIIKQ
jgi:hypothetical protein